MRISVTLGLLVSLFVLSCLPAGAQQFGGTPSSVKWKQVNTPAIRVIYPQDISDTTARRIASVTNYLQQHYSASIGGHIRKVNLVLQNNITLSNAYVALAPYRSEFFLMPPMNALELGAQNWADNLSIHEFRHVQQYSNFNHGLSKTFSILFGQDGQALANATAVPDWFFEGDAVYNETRLSRQGRGRLPFFFSGFRALLDKDKSYTYMQIRNGSYRFYMPNWYQFGYMMVAYGYEKYGSDFWKNVTQDAVRFKPLFYPLQHAVEKYSGDTYHHFVHGAFDLFSKQWQYDTLGNNTRLLTLPQQNNVVNYQYPYATGNGSYVVLKNSYRSIPAFYRVDSTGHQQRIATRDIAYDDYFSYNNGRIAYAAYRADVRWGNRDFSDIKVLDMATGNIQSITRNGKYFTPDISHNGNQLAAVNYTPAQQSALVLLQSNGQVIRTVAAPGKHIYAYPKFTSNDSSLYVMERNAAGEMSINLYRIADSTWETILPFANRITGYPVVQGDTLLYTCSNKGADELWAYVRTARQHYRVAAYNTGIYQAALTPGGRAVASIFTADGYQLAELQPQWAPAAAAGDTLTPLYVQHPFNSGINNTLQQVPDSAWAVSRYRKATRLFNFHSWRPYYSQPDLTVAVYGQNVLNTLQSQLYYTYNYDEGYSRVGYSGVYGGWYVQPVFGISETFNRNALYRADTRLYWNELNANAGLQLPFDFSHGKQYRYLTLSSTYNIQQVQWTGKAKQMGAQNIHFGYVESRLQYSGQIQSAQQHIYPRWAQNLLLQYRTIVDKYTAHQLLASAAFYLPALMKSHNLVITGAYQARDTTGNYYFSDNFPFSRGYDAIDYPRMWRVGVNYHVPLFYPDWGFGNIVYFKRIRFNAFYDYTNGKSLRTGLNTRFNTTGGELYFDTRWWNQQAVSFGIRYNYQLNKNIVNNFNKFEIVLPVNL
ncbi:TolB-like translocation protein [Deminuibacter soli]|uniref:Uncharacterized protein n=1 Tax=Deminuibacter soli TaxID=2291815 RepID=A0A3E1NIS8_9BACT|nr:hypothetical protein [Deminuibacter soli]RFM27724.1 hypothetical protein DXN05_13550 [Deminuibacter soli]